MSKPSIERKKPTKRTPAIHQGKRRHGDSGREQASSEVLVAAIVAQWCSPIEFGELVEDDRINALWTRLIHRHVDELPDYMRKAVMALPRRFDELDKLQGRVSAADRKLLVELIDGIEVQDYVKRNAAFLVGLELGRRGGWNRAVGRGIS